MAAGARSALSGRVCRRIGALKNSTGLSAVSQQARFEGARLLACRSRSPLQCHPERGEFVRAADGTHAVEGPAVCLRGINTSGKQQVPPLAAEVARSG